MAGDADEDMRVPTAWDTWLRWARWLGVAAPPRGYQLTRWLILRLLGFVYVFAFLGLIFQGPALLGSHGLTPVATFVDLVTGDGMTFWDNPSFFMWGASDTALAVWAYVGLALAIACTLGYANLPSLLALWFIYGSYERVGQLWFSFGWEIQILETTLIAAFLAHPWDPRPLAARSPPTTAIVLMRWMVFRIMLGAGLIKLRGDACWSDLTCLDYHFETQPIPNPLSPFFHHLPQPLLAAGVAANHLVEVIAPFFVFGPRRLRLIAGVMMLGFQVVLILSGNLAFLNWLTVVPILACFDDDAILRVMPRRLRAWVKARLAPVQPRSGRWLAIAIGASIIPLMIWPPLFFGFVLGATGLAIAKRLDWHQLVVGVFAALVIVKSWPVIDNLTGKKQAMNRSYDALALVNTYGAFGAVTYERHEIVIEGTLADDPETGEWRAYELPCKPGDVTRRPCVLGPYHRRLDWLIWFAAMYETPREHPWLVHLAWKLLDGDRTIRELLIDPFDGVPPKWVRIRRYLYHMEPYSSDTWWTRELVDDEWLQPVNKASEGFAEVLARYRWPSPSVH
ncbi:MAG TPA: lipase maturation factor family protein [Kofleriaceae bacterium]